MESNVRKAGISMVALVITIIVLIVLTSAVVITGVGTPKQAQLAVFYNNIDTVQDLVNIQMGNNMITAALEGKGENYKWVDIVDGCNNDNWSTNGVVTFEPLVIGLDKNVARISTTLLEKTSLSTSEMGKYYVDNNGVVYYEGFVYEGQTLYTKSNNIPELVTNPIDGRFNNEKGVNSPKLLDGMVGIYWDNGEEVYSHVNGENADYTRANMNADFDYDQWYDYVDTTENANTSHWANAKTSDGSYWVWIPRYAYSITSGYHTSTAGEIEIEFLKGKTNEGVSGRTTWDNISGQGKWNVHPAFIVEGTQLTGIWVAKYEMSGENESGVAIQPGNVILSSTVRAVSKPGVRSWKNIEMDTSFANGYNYNRNLESHLIKNNEWGAVAYLSHSKYGRNGTQLTVNTSGSCYTGGGSGTAYKTNILQSTTGNEYGIYDLSGAEWERVAAYLTTEVDSTNRDNYIGELLTAESKYKDIYTNYEATATKYGEAMYETSATYDNTTGWFGDYSQFAIANYPFFSRGGDYRGGDTGNGSGSGAFSFAFSIGNVDIVTTWRVVLWGALE